MPIASVEDFGYCGAIQRFDIDASGIYGILDGDPPKRLLPMTLGDPSWSPAGDRLAFQSFGNIFTIALDGDSLDTSTVQQLTFDGISYQPAWSPDGSTIAYYLAGCGNADTTSCGVAIMTPSGEEKTQIIRGVYPSWYPDSRRILYMGLGEEFFKYDIVDSLATRVTRFKTPTKNNYQPAVAPDGGSIAFASQRDGPLNIWIVDTDGTNLRRLTSGGTTDRFCWSPDSQYILYINYDADDFSEDNGSLWMINVQSSEKHRLVHGSLK